MKQTIAQQIKWDFEVNGTLVIEDKNGRTIYREFSNGYWGKYERNSQGKLIYYEDSNGYWEKHEYDSQGNQIYFEDLNGVWETREFDSQGKLIYFEDSKGEIEDNRPKSCEGKIVEIGGEKFKLVKV